MSELINNLEYRKERTKEIILELPQGKTVDQVKNKFNNIVKDIAPVELAAIEQELINEGLPIEEVRRLCDVHMEVFKTALEKTPDPEVSPGHPIHTFPQPSKPRHSNTPFSNFYFACYQIITGKSRTVPRLVRIKGWLVVNRPAKPIS